MKIVRPFRSLSAYALVGIILPVALVMFASIAAGIYTYQRTLATLLVARQRQIAITAAVSVSEVIGGYARLLEALAGNPDMVSGSALARSQALESAGDALRIFNRGVAIVDPEGVVLTFAPLEQGVSGLPVSHQQTFEAVRERLAPVFSDVLLDEQRQENLFFLGVPIRDEQGVFQGALIGAVNLQDATLSKPIDRFSIGTDGFVYLVDSHGRVIYHPDASNIGADFGNRPILQGTVAETARSRLWRSPSGERLFEAVAPVTPAGWGLVLRESWDSASAPARAFTTAVVLLGLLALLIVVLVSWIGVRRIVIPVQLLNEQIGRLSRGEPLVAFQETGIVEIDTLDSAFSQMERQITAYRAGLQRYIDALTQSQENERRRIAQELHDETVQNLLAVSRRLELYQASEEDAEKLEKLRKLQAVVGDTLTGIRHIVQDLRPMMLEDLGLIPALQTLTRAARTGTGGVPHVNFEVCGEAAPLSPEQELAIYRITQEALNNVRRHAAATGLQVRLAFNPGEVALEISDNGSGFHPPESLAEFSQRGHFGLLGIQERVLWMGGRVAIRSAPGEGTQISVEIPVKE